MGNRESAPKSLDDHKEQNAAVVTAHEESHQESAEADVPKVEKLSNERKEFGKGKKVVYSLNVTLSCTEDGTKRERELGLTWIPVTIADLQDQIQEQFNIPVFDQKLTFGPSVLSAKESLQSYSLRNGDNITVEYSSEADVKPILDTVSYLKTTLAFLESVEPQLLLFPISRELQAQLRQGIDVAQIDNFVNIFRSCAQERKKQIANSLLFINGGGLTLLQRLHSAILKYPFKTMPLHVQLLEGGMNQMLWTLSSNTETEAAVLKELKLDNIVRSLFRVTAVPNAAIFPPRNPYTEQIGDIQMQVIHNLFATSTGCLSCVLEYEATHLQIDLASNAKFLEQIIGLMQTTTGPFSNNLVAKSLLVALAYNLDTHQYLCKPHVIQAIIRTWKRAEPTPENNATPAECVYLKYLSAVLISMLCASRQSFSAQYLQVTELLEKFLREADYNELHKYEGELGFVWNKYIPYFRVAYMPYNTKRSVLACGSDPRYRELQKMCIEMNVLFFQVILNGARERKRIVEQGLMDYVICLPSVLPAESRAQQRAKDLVAMLGKEVHYQPPSLNTMVRARLAVTHFGLEKVLKTPVQELLSEVYPAESNDFHV